MLFDITTTQEQDLRHAHNDEIVTLIFCCHLRRFKVCEERGYVAQLCAHNETDNTGRVAWLLEIHAAEFIS